MYNLTQDQELHACDKKFLDIKLISVFRLFRVLWMKSGTYGFLSDPCNEVAFESEFCMGAHAGGQNKFFQNSEAQYRWNSYLLILIVFLCDSFPKFPKSGQMH